MHSSKSYCISYIVEQIILNETVDYNVILKKMLYCTPIKFNVFWASKLQLLAFILAAKYIIVFIHFHNG